MDYNVEVHISEREITDLGREQAIARATVRAWHHAVEEGHPKHSLTLRATEEREVSHGVLDWPGLYILFRFDVDP